MPEETNEPIDHIEAIEEGTKDVKAKRKALKDLAKLNKLIREYEGVYPHPLQQHQG